MLLVKTLTVVGAVAVLALPACSRKGTAGTTATSDGQRVASCVHPLKDLSDDQQKGTVAAATAGAMSSMQEGGPPLVDCPLGATPPVSPKVVFAHCGGVREVTWSTGLSGASSYFDVDGKLVAYRESSERPGGYSCSDGTSAQVAVYGTIPTCTPWTEQRYCAPGSAAAAPSASTSTTR